MNINQANTAAKATEDATTKQQKNKYAPQERRRPKDAIDV